MLFNVLEQLTFRIWDLPQPQQGVSTYQAILKQSGSNKTFTLDFIKKNAKWFVDPTNFDVLESELVQLHESNPSEGNVHTSGYESARASLRTLMTRFNEQDPSSFNLVSQALNLSELSALSQRYESHRLAEFLKRALNRVVSPVFQEVTNDTHYPQPVVLFEHPSGSIVLAPQTTEAGTIWQFTPDTIKNIRKLYAHIDDLP